MVITVTINPAMDKVFMMDKFQLNRTNRIQNQFQCVGGKGTHVSVNLGLMGIRSCAVGVVMGPTGDEIIQQLSIYNMDIRFIKLADGNSRTNYILVDGQGNCTLVAEKGQTMDQTVSERLVAHYEGLVGKGDTVVISGDASNQRDTGLQERLIQIAVKNNARFCLDASGEHLAAGIARKPFLVKPNLDELEYLFGKSISTEEDILSALMHVRQAGAANIVVSCGEKGSYAFLEGRLYKVLSPKVQVRNTVGCGDALLSGLIAGFEKMLSPVENLKQATAVAAATAMKETTVGFDSVIAARLREETRVNEIRL